MSSTVNKQKGIQLIPFTVNKVVEQVNEIPPGVQLIHAPQVWGKSVKGQDVVVAVLDTGCDTNHIDLKSYYRRKISQKIMKLIQMYLDNNGHGTHVAERLPRLKMVSVY